MYYLVCRDKFDIRFDLIRIHWCKVCISALDTYLKEKKRMLRGMGRHSWKCSRFKRTQMKIIHKYNLVHNFDFICFPYK